MEDILERIETRTYALETIADLMDMSVTTLRRYCFGLEKQGYRFPRVTEGELLITEKELTIILCQFT